MWQSIIYHKFIDNKANHNNSKNHILIFNNKNHYNWVHTFNHNNISNYNNNNENDNDKYIDHHKSISVLW